MSVIDYSPTIILLSIAIGYFLACKFDDWFRKSRQLDKKIGKEYTVVNHHNKTSKTYNTATGELVSKRNLDNDFQVFSQRMLQQHQRLLEEHVERVALIDREQYDRLRAMGYDIMGGARSHIKPKESKPKEPVGYDIKDQFDGVP